jgi:hypothetical protein
MNEPGPPDRRRWFALSMADVLFIYFTLAVLLSRSSIHTGSSSCSGTCGSSPTRTFRS